MRGSIASYILNIPQHITTLRRLDDELGFVNKNAEKTTLARAAAVSDIRNLATFIAANHYMVPITNSNLIMNADATQCLTSGEAKRKVKVKVLKGRNTSDDPLKVLPTDKDSLTAFFIKYYMVIGAGGSLAPPIFIVADENMTEGRINVHEVHGLGIGVDPSSLGYVVFCKSRTLCHLFYTWLIESVIVPYVANIKISKNLDQDSVCWFTLDGESKQIVH